MSSHCSTSRTMRSGSGGETDDLVIYQANPVAVNNKEVFDSIKDLRTMAILYENKRENFLCKHCNIMYKGLASRAISTCRRSGGAGW